MHAQVPDFPWEGSATHPLALTPIFYMDASDFKEEDSPDYFGLAPSKWVGLKYSGCIYANEIRKDPSGQVVEIIATFAQLPPDGKR
jgi:glutaminyl-tRNA synthetase